MKISVFGLGYVGAVSCACLAKLGHTVIGVDVYEDKVGLINAGRSPIVEPELEELLKAAVENGNLSATTNQVEAIEATDAAIVCVGTPSTATGGIDDQYLLKVCAQIGEAIRDKKTASQPFTLFVRSTCLPPTHQKLQDLIQASSGRALGEQLQYVCHPEFLRESVAVWDFFNPPKIVFGTREEAAKQSCADLYPNIEAPTFWVDPEVASMVKYADNCFHAVKVTFGNEIGMLSSQFGVNGQDVMEIFCSDTKLNISPKYLRPGAPFGGSCLPKDLRAVLDMARQNAISVPMLAASVDSNSVQLKHLLSRITGRERNNIGVIGLSFKEGTDDVRESPMVPLVEHLTGKGYRVQIYDAHLSFEQLRGVNRSYALESIPHLAELLSERFEEVVGQADTLVVSHRLDDETWQKIKADDPVRIIDLVGIDCLKTRPSYEGLYW